MAAQEINAAEAELERLGGGRPVAAKTAISVEAAILKEEARLIEENSVEGLVEDEETRYFLAVGHLENSIKELRTLKQLNLTTGTLNTKYLAIDSQEIQKVASITESLEKEIRENNGVAMEDQLKKVNQSKRKELTNDTRANKMILKSFKVELRDFLNDNESLNPEYNTDHENNRFGHILQVLWKNYTENGIHDYVSIESLEFDVDSDALEHLKRAGLVVSNSKNPDKIRLVDFTQ